MSIRTEALAVLGLAPGATAEEIKQAYRDLAKVWHPDRFRNDPRLRLKAEERLKAINVAHEVLLASAVPARRDDGRRERAARVSERVPAASSAPTAGRERAVKNRHVRLPLPGVEVRFGNRIGRLLNLSLTGGQLLLDSSPDVGSETTMLLEAGRRSLTLPARVIRVNPATSHHPLGAGRDAWTVSVAFVDLPSDVQLSIPQFYNSLLAASR